MPQPMITMPWRKFREFVCGWSGYYLGGVKGMYVSTCKHIRNPTLGDVDCMDPGDEEGFCSKRNCPLLKSPNTTVE